jgi:ribose 5-phosphate isomerase B
MIDEEKIREMVRRVVHRAVGVTPPSSTTHRGLVTEPDLLNAPPGEAFVVPDGALVTPLARQVAMERGVSLVEGDPSSGSPQALTRQPVTGAAGVKAVAFGADHGGYELKEMLKGHAGELGYAILDCGTDSTESVDYPDFALAVAQLVASGRAWRGILVDGAGIGSCMAANKVPGVRAALCYDEATAVNSRAHNDANVLTLGAGMIGPALGRQIVTTWLKTPAGGDRHAKRVGKIMDIERRFLRP